MYNSDDPLDLDGRGAADVTVPAEADLHWARGMLDGVCNAPDGHIAAARFDEMLEGARASVGRTEAVVIAAKKCRDEHTLKKAEAGAVVLEMMALRFEQYESAAGLEEVVQALLSRFDGVLIPDAYVDWGDGDELYDPIEEVIRHHQRLTQAAFLSARGEHRLAKLAVERPEYLESLWEHGIDSLLDGMCWGKRGKPRRRDRGPPSAA